MDCIHKRNYCKKSFWLILFAVLCFISEGNKLKLKNGFPASRRTRKNKNSKGRVGKSRRLAGDDTQAYVAYVPDGDDDSDDFASINGICDDQDADIEYGQFSVIENLLDSSKYDFLKRPNTAYSSEREASNTADPVGVHFAVEHIFEINQKDQSLTLT